VSAPPWVVLEDDPTGIQLLAGVALAADDAPEALRAAAAMSDRALHVLTNSRAVDAEAAAALVERAARRALEVVPGATVVLRGDSTLRGHVHEEHAALARVTAPGATPVLVLLPALPGAGRVTRAGVHRLVADGRDVPVHETEYARDGVFTYTTSDLLAWAQERSGGRLPARDGAGLPLGRLRAEGPAAVVDVLKRLAAAGRPSAFAPDSETVADQGLVAAGVRDALALGVPLIVRASPSAVGALCGTLADAPREPPRGRLLVVCGSYVPGSGRQLAALAAAYPDALVELDLDAGGDAPGAAAAACLACLERAGIAVLCTPRERAAHRLGLDAGAAVMELLTDAVARVARAADVVVAKGGITSAEVLRRGLGAAAAAVDGPLAPGGVLLRASGRDGVKPYVIVPGNIGGPTLLRELADVLRGSTGRTGYRMTMASDFSAIAREPRLSDKVARQLQSSIVDGTLAPGDRLPPERDLGDQFGVSRTVIREAVRTLVAKGLLEARAGSGVRVATIDASAVRETMGMYLRVNGELDYGDLHEVRALLEIEIAGDAAERAVVSDLDALEASCAAFAAAKGDVEKVSELDVEFHRLIAQATHNPLFVVLLDSIGDVLLDVRRATMGISGRPQQGLKHHRAILARIRDRDADGARAAMREHLEDSEKAWRRLSDKQTRGVLGG